MIYIRPYKDSDAGTILSWCKNEENFYKWSAGVLGDYPITEEEFGFVKSIMPFTAFDENGIVGFFTFRNPEESNDELRAGFVIVAPEMRGKGYGKAMLQQGLKYAFQIYGASKVSLAVFENNESAYYCYKAAGFQDVAAEKEEVYHVLGQDWKCKELVIENM